jgi:hypothetical protein
VSALAGLVGRGLLAVGDAGDDKVLRRHQLLSALEGTPLPAVEEVPGPQEVPPQVEVEVPAQAIARASVPDGRPRSDSPVIPERPEPFTPARRPDHPEDAPALVRASAESGSVTALGGHGSVNGATAMQPDAVPGVVERDPSVNKSLLLRLIAGVRGL